MNPPLEDRERLLSSARAIFVAEGVEGLSVRRVAQDAGCTTMAVYSRYGGKSGLIAALYDEGFEQLAEAQQAIDKTLTGADRVMALCMAYRQCAHQFPKHYALMLGHSNVAFKPSEAGLKKAGATLEVLTEAVLPLVTSGRGSRNRARAMSKRLFALCHGWVSLELQGMSSTQLGADEAYRLAVKQLLGDSQSRAASG
ncbi:MAG: TetR/AcrR family transcriptional regulator [Burkholderiaceae bacterium]